MHEEDDRGIFTPFLQRLGFKSGTPTEGIIKNAGRNGTKVKVAEAGRSIPIVKAGPFRVFANGDEKVMGVLLLSQELHDRPDIRDSIEQSMQFGHVKRERLCCSESGFVVTPPSEHYEGTAFRGDPGATLILQ